MKIVRSLLLILSVLPVSPITLAEAPADNSADFDCEAMHRAHARLINGCFAARRHFRATINQKLAIRELVQLKYTAGRLELDVIEIEHPKKSVQIDGEGDMAIDISFSCDRLTRQTGDQYELESAEDPERIIFDYDRENDVLLPASWHFEDTARFLFKKFHMQAHADYSNVVYHSCDTPTDTGPET